MYLFCQVRMIGVENILMQWIEWNIISWTSCIIRKNHISLGHQSTFYHLSSENKELIVLLAYQFQGCNCWKSPWLKIQVLASFWGGEGMLSYKVPWTYLGIKTLSLGLKMAFMSEKDIYWGKCKCLRDYFQVKCDISLLW